MNRETAVPFEFEPHQEVAIDIMAERTVDLIETVRDEGMDVLIFTDKSARPLSWLFMGAWRKLYPNERRPEIRFLNVGSEKKPADFPDPRKYSPTDEEVQDYAAEAVARFRIDDQLKKLYERQGFEKGKKVLVVEEQSGSGFSFQVIKQGLEKAFPKSDVRLFDTMLVSWNWGFVAEAVKQGKGSPDWISRDYGDATVGGIDRAPEDIVSRPYHTSGKEMLKRIEFGNVVEDKVWRPHQYLRKDLKRAADKAATLAKSADRSWREDY